MKSTTENTFSKTTCEKPVSLSPLSLKEALKGLLKVEPEKESPDKKSGQDNENSPT